MLEGLVFGPELFKVGAEVGEGYKVGGAGQLDDGGFRGRVLEAIDAFGLEPEEHLGEQFEREGAGGGKRLAGKCAISCVDGVFEHAGDLLEG